MNKKGKFGDILPFIIIGGILLYAFIIIPGGILKIGGDAFIEARFYDKAGNLIEDIGTFAVVGGVEGVHSMDLTVNVQNTGDKPLTMDIISVSPTLFSNALSKVQKMVDVGQTISWTSSIFSVDSFVGTTQRFQVIAKGTYMIGSEIKTLQKTGYLDLTFAPDPEGDFTVNVDSTFAGDPGSGTGGGTLPPTGDFVIFRSSVLSLTTQNFAFTPTCGTSLGAYRFSSTLTSGSINDCNWYFSATNKALLGSITFNNNNYVLADDSITNSYLLFCLERNPGYIIYRYLPGGTVSTSATSIDLSKEVLC